MTEPARLLRINEVIERTALSRSHIYALIKQDRFPAQRQLGRKCARWVEADIDAWIRDQAA